MLDVIEKPIAAETDKPGVWRILAKFRDGVNVTPGPGAVHYGANIWLDGQRFASREEAEKIAARDAARINAEAAARGRRPVVEWWKPRFFPA